MEFLDVKAVAKRYGVSLRTVQNWCRDGVLPEPIRLGRRLIRWRLSTLEAWERASEQATNPQTEEQEAPSHA